MENGKTEQMGIDMFQKATKGDRMMNGSRGMTLVLTVTIVLWGLGAVAGTPWTGEAWAAQKVDTTTSARADAEIEIEVMAGQLRIYGWDRLEVKVTGEVGDNVEFEVSTDDDGEISIEAEPEGRITGEADIEVDLEIWVPMSASVETETLSASIEAQDLGGEVSFESVSGNLRVTGSPTSLEAESVSGSVSLTGSQTSADVETVSGKIVLEGVAGDVDAASVSGGIDVMAGDVHRAGFESVTGNVSFSGVLSADAQLEVESHSGNVVLDLGADPNASFSIETFTGDIESPFGVEATRTSKHAPGKVLSFSQGSGGAQVTVETFSGNVTIKR